MFIIKKMTEQTTKDEISLSTIPMQESEVLLANRSNNSMEEGKSEVPSGPNAQSEEISNVNESEVAGDNVGISLSEMRISQQAEIRRVRFSESGERPEEVKTQTRFIVREATTDEEAEQSFIDEKELKKQQQEEDMLYFFGYFKWYWGHHGFFKAFKNFFWQRIKNGVIFSVFNSIGMAIGTFFFKRWVLAETFLKIYC